MSSSRGSTDAVSQVEPVALWLVGDGGRSDSDDGEADDENDEEPEPAQPVTEYILDVHRETLLPIDALQSLDAQGLLRHFPRDADGTLASVGSIMHGSGKCSPCLFHVRRCCTRGPSCQFCHLPHQRKTKLRLKSPKMTCTLQEHDKKSKGHSD
mmetsp:Transcript_10964/g.30129  ORF Transcript_10964/g.30129 Transcript_10964/m.30129 type:complete len:154 (-) Transcript_10964:87-548(-)